jgi:putative transcriptional regulator
MENLRGQLLVASPALVDPNFHRTVVLVLEHGEEGALGVVLNRPSSAEVAEAAPALAGLVDEDARVHVGGPVEPSAVLVLTELAGPTEAAVVVFDGVGLLAGEGDPNDWAAVAGQARVFAGYAGWAPGQLETELAEEAWIVEAAEAGDVFAAAPEELWADVLRRKGGQFALLARMPPDPSVN